MSRHSLRPPTRVFAPGLLAVLLALAGAPGDGRATIDGQGVTPVVYQGHPRLIVGGYRGVSIEDLRAACAEQKLRPQCEQIGGRHVLDDAMRYLLTGDADAAKRVENRLDALPACEDLGDTYERTMVGGYALAFDWVHETISDPAPLERKLGECGMYIVRQGLGTNSPHLWHGYTSQAAALALVALAVDDGFPDRETLLTHAEELFRGTALEAYSLVGGAWPEGYNYERTHFFSGDPPFQYVSDAMRAWDSAVKRDHPDHDSIFDTITEEEGDWLRGLAYHLVYGSIPAYGAAGKVTLMRGGDMPTGQAYPNKQYRPFVDSIARVYSDPLLAAWGLALERDWSFVGGSGTYHSIHLYSLPYNYPVAPGPPRPLALPLGRIWARVDLGYVISRSGWQADDTVIGYRAGKWFTGHQHMDQGHLDIWRSGPLAVDSGVYARWGSEHREAYYSRTVAHNTLLIPSVGEDFVEHPDLGVDVNDGGQRIHTYVGCAQCMQSVAEWRSNVGDGRHFEAGSIEAFDDGPWYTVVRSDITSAYNSTRYSTPGNRPKVDLVQRDLTYLRPDVILVVDRVRTVGDAGPARFVLHLPRRPELMEPRVVQGSAENGILESDTPSFHMDNGTGGRLAVQGLGDGHVRAVGGPDYRYWVDGANRESGAGGLEGAPAEPGLWRIESIGGRPGQPTRGDNEALLEHVLTITDTGRSPMQASTEPGIMDPSKPPPAMVVRLGTGRGQRIVVASAALPRETVPFVAFTLDSSAPVLLTDLEPGAPYGLSFDSVTTAQITVGQEGVLAVPASTSESFAAGRCPPDPGAGSLWRTLCGGAHVATPTTGATASPFETPTVRPRPTGDGRFRVSLPRLDVARYVFP